MPKESRTHPVEPSLFREVYDSPASLPGRDRWVTSHEDVRRVEELLGIPTMAIGAPLWVSGDERVCPCGRETNWLDIVASALGRVHDRALVTRVILGEQRYVNTEVPDFIHGLLCFECGQPIDGIRSFKCHNWAYAHGRLEEVVKAAKTGSPPSGPARSSGLP